MKDRKHEARKADPTSYLESRGYQVVRQGRHLSIRDDGEEAYRVTEKPNGIFLACRRDGSGVGDVLSLVKEIEGCSFAQALAILAGGGGIVQRRRRTAPRSPTLPRMSYVEEGCEYLASRGISQSVLNHAIESGFLSCAHGAVFYVGRDSKGAVRAVTRRGYLPGDSAPKRDLAGTDKRYAPILPGETDTHAWIVEGGADALAIHTLAVRASEPRPTVIVSGGVGVLAYLKSPEVQGILERVETVCVACERERDVETQMRTDERREKLLSRIPNACEVWPSYGAKDIADSLPLPPPGCVDRE